MSRKILVPLDGSKLAECALSHVKAFLKDGLAADVTILNVVKVDVPWEEAYDDHFDINALRKQQLTQSEKYLADVKSRLASEGVTVRADLIEANRPAETIIDYARKNGMDMIVIATHGYTGMKKLLLGSVAFGILNQSPLPVYLIRPEACPI